MNFLNGDCFFLLILLIPGVIALYLFAGRRRKKLVRELLGYGRDVSPLVPEAVAAEVEARGKKR